MIPLRTSVGVTVWPTSIISVASSLDMLLSRTLPIPVWYYHGCFVHTTVYQPQWSAARSCRLSDVLVVGVGLLYGVSRKENIYCLSFHLHEFNIYISFYLSDFEWEMDIKMNFPHDVWLTLSVSWHFYGKLDRRGLNDQLLLPGFLSCGLRVRAGLSVKLMKL